MRKCSKYKHGIKVEKTQKKKIKKSELLRRIELLEMKLIDFEKFQNNKVD